MQVLTVLWPPGIFFHMSHDITSTPALDGPVPRHVAVIMDGNGRWASDRGLARHAGHREGMKAVREVIHGCVEAGVGILTLFAFSTENWQRPEEEILALMTLLKIYAEQEKDELRDQGVEVHVLGDLSRMDDETRDAVRCIQEATAGGLKLRLNLMISYSGRADIIRAVRDLAARVAAGELTPGEIDDATFSAALSTGDVPDPDLLIRTSGEFRISNFMLWQLAYTEIFISPVLWPDFTRQDLFESVSEYQRRERRFGRVSSS
ncbi:MAG: polyprenyl diphosphate synthase [Gemmatimonadota bacterium]